MIVISEPYLPRKKDFELMFVIFCNVIFALLLCRFISPTVTLANNLVKNSVCGERFTLIHSPSETSEPFPRNGYIKTQQSVTTPPGAQYFFAFMISCLSIMCWSDSNIPYILVRKEKKA